jgi:uncharacterized protein YggL (DUF469 family)
MTAPCPALGFVVVIEPIAGLGEAEREALRRAWSTLLDARGLQAHGAIRSTRSAIVVSSEASQATDDDREAVRHWLSSRHELRRTSVGEIEDLDARTES